MNTYVSGTCEWVCPRLCVYIPAVLLTPIIPERRANETKNRRQSTHEKKKAAMRGCESGGVDATKTWHSFYFYGIPLFRSQQTRRRCASIASYSAHSLLYFYFYYSLAHCSRLYKCWCLRVDKTTNSKLRKSLVSHRSVVFIRSTFDQITSRIEVLSATAIDKLIIRDFEFDFKLFFFRERNNDVVQFVTSK